jgi:nucleoside-diphosphate-sugar epimerase
MPLVAKGDRVLVTGANGYIGCHVICTLLSKNYAVRGVVRSPAKGRHLSELFQPFREKFELVIVEDIMVVGICCWISSPTV